MSDGFSIALPSAVAAEQPVDVAIVLGSGFSAVADAVEEPRVVPYAQIDGFPVPRRHVAGHAGKLVLGMLGGKRVAVFAGRLHCYEGFWATEVAFPVRLASALGARTLVVTNASGAIANDLSAGDIVVIGDHLNLACENPLTGWSGGEDGTPFVSMHDAYDPELRALALVAAGDANVEVVAEQTYAWMRGPTYETAAEVAMLRMLGADVVGMSTVPEVIAARALGMRVLGLSLVSNSAAAPGLAHDEVLEAGRAAQERVLRLAIAILQRLS
jgi:purine-nucleoside phosphorylase